MIIRHELRQNTKSLLIWALSVGVSSALCILLYESVADSIKSIANLYQDMGGVSKALGMDKVSIATLGGYYAAEIALIYSLGAAMYATLLGISIVAKEEEGHTAEFLYSLPLSRQRVLNGKYMGMLVCLMFFNVISIALEFLGLWKVNMTFDYTAFWQYHGLVLLLQIEIASLCFMISAFTRKRLIGLGMGIVLLAYFMDIICRLVEKVDYLKFMTPFYFANATDRFGGQNLDWKMLLVALAITLISIVTASLIYNNRDLAS
ncbi:ABC transporter permease subunit [Streptococcus hongkongensis]|nr:ABC transporter permease [Streptococcus uberis]